MGNLTQGKVSPCRNALVWLFRLNPLLLKRHSIIREPKPCLGTPCYSPVQCNLSSLFHTFTAGWRPESNRASFLMMLPTPGMTAWSMRTSHNIRRCWRLTASSEREKLNCWEHTSRPSIALTFCTQSSVNLHTRAPQGQLRHAWNNTSMNTFFHAILQVGVFLFSPWDGTAKVKFQMVEIKCLSGRRTIHHNLTVNEQDKCQAKETVFFMRQQPPTSHTA